MRNALVIAAREFEEKRFVAYAALAFAALPFLIGVLPMVNGKSPGAVIAILSVLLASGFTLGLGVITGASFVGRDLSDGRMSFYFSRPVGALSIWFGKLVAGIVLIVGCFGVIAIPARLMGDAWKSQWDLGFGQLSALVLGSAVALFLIAHVIGTFARSHSPLIALDFAAAIICGVSIRLLVLPLVRGLALTLVNAVLIALAAALVIAIVVGGAWQLREGRADRRRSHLALSQCLWSIMGLTLIMAGAFVAWVVSAKPSDLTKNTGATYAAGSPFLSIFGETRNRGGYHAGYLIDLGDGSARSVPPQSIGAAHFTRDGASVLIPRFDNGAADLVVYKHGVAAPIETGLTLSPTDRFFVSDDGKRIATVGSDTLSVYDVPQRKSLISVRAPSDGRGFYRGYFLTPDLFRLYVQGRDGLSIYELDLRARTLKATGAIAATSYVVFALDPAGSRMLVSRSGVDGLTLNDARTGTIIRSVAASSKNIATSRFLRDGRIVLVETAGQKANLELHSPDGALLRSIPLDTVVERASYLGDDGERIILSTWQRRDGSTRSLLAVNLVRGVVERSERGPFRWTASASYWDNRPTTLPLREVFYGDDAGHVVGWTPATGAKRIVSS